MNGILHHSYLRELFTSQPSQRCNNVPAPSIHTPVATNYRAIYHHIQPTMYPSSSLNPKLCPPALEISLHPHPAWQFHHSLLDLREVTIARPPKKFHLSLPLWNFNDLHPPINQQWRHISSEPPESRNQYCFLWKDLGVAKMFQEKWRFSCGS